MKLLVASNNSGKLREYRELLHALPIEIVSPSENGISLEVDETGQTFAENATLKAQAFAERSGLMTLADDSGLEVDALHGEPGVRSARYAGPNETDTARCTLLLAKMTDVPWESRGARFRCVVAIVVPGDLALLPLSEGICEGFITRVPRGKHGFGYDPVFFVPEFGVTMAELPAATKNRISHRGRAVRAAKRVMAENLFPNLIGELPPYQDLPQASEVCIRPAIASDASALQRNCCATRPLDWVQGRLQQALDDAAEGLSAPPLVGEARGEVIGYVQLNLRDRKGTIVSLAVSSDWQQRGMEQALIHVATEGARERIGDALMEIEISPAL